MRNFYLMKFFYLINLIKFIYLRKHLYIPGVTLTTRDYDYGYLPQEGGKMMALSKDLIFKFTRNDILLKKEEEKSDEYKAQINEYKNNMEHMINFLKYFSLAEQSSFLHQTNDNAIFNVDAFLSYNDYTKLMFNKSSISNLTTFQLIKNSFFEFVKKNEMRIPIGLGAIIKVANKYGSKNPENFDLYTKVKALLSEIYETHHNMIKVELEFIEDMLNQLIHKRYEILHISSLNISDYSIPMTTLDLTLFEKFAKEKQKFNLLLNKNILLAQVNIGAMDGCNGGINEDTALSSYSGINNITKKHGENVSHNLANGTRYGSFTQNGYYLDFGFGFGNIRFDNQQPILNFVDYGPNRIKIKTLRTIFFRMTRNYYFKGVANYGNRILNRINNIIITKNDLYNKTFLNGTESYIKKALEVAQTKNKSNVTLIYRTNNNTYNYTYNEFNTDLVYDYKDNPLKKGVNNIYERKGKASENFDAYDGIIGSYTNLENQNDTFWVLRANKSNQESIEIMINNEIIEEDNETLASTLNACFGVIYSGGKNDKDACRNTFEENCGNELDYRCKESGLYDILTENPAYSENNSLPQPCRKGVNEYQCQFWFYKYMLNGNITLKPSAIIGFSLLTQSNYDKKKQLNDEHTIVNETIRNFTIGDNLSEWFIPSITDLENTAEKASFYQIESSGFVKIYLLSLIIFMIILF